MVVDHALGTAVVALGEVHIHLDFAATEWSKIQHVQSVLGVDSRAAAAIPHVDDATSLVGQRGCGLQANRIAGANVDGTSVVDVSWSGCRIDEAWDPHAASVVVHGRAEAGGVDAADDGTGVVENVGASQRPIGERAGGIGSAGVIDVLDDASVGGR